MSAFDRWGNPIPMSGGGPGRFRARHASDIQGAQQQQQLFQDEAGQFWVPDEGGGGGSGSSGGRHHHANSSAGMRPAQIVINNENNVIEDHPDYYYEPPRPAYGQRVYVQDQQIVQVGRGRSPSELSYSTRRQLDDLERLKREKEQEELIKQVEKDLQLKAAKKHEDELKRIEEEKELKKKAVEEWKAEEEKKKRHKKEKEEEREAIGQEYMRQQLRREGWTEEEIDDMFKKKEKKRRASSPSLTSTSIVINKQPRWSKVSVKHIDPETLDAYKIEWDWAEGEDGIIVIYRELTLDDQDILFEHTRKLRERKLIKFAEVEIPVVKQVHRDKNGRLVVIRKKDRARSKSPGVVKKFFI